MKAETVIKTRLSEHSGVVSLVADRVYPVVLPQSPTYPCVTYRRTGSDRSHGPHADHGYARVDIEVVIYDNTYTGVKTIAEQVRLALSRYGSSEAGSDIGGVTVYDIYMERDQDAYDPDLDIYQVQNTFTVHYQE